MAGENEILVQAHLDIPNSTDNIKKDLKDVSNNLAQQKQPEFIGHLNLDKTRAVIESQVKKLSNLKVTLGVNVGAVQSQVQTAINNATKSVANTNKIPLSFDLNNMSNLKNQVETFAKDLAKLNGFSLGKVSANLSNTDALKTADIQLYNEALKQTVTLKYQLSEDGKKFD